MRTVTRRLMPLLFIAFVFEFIARVNVGFAKLQMLEDLHMSNAVYGLGAGIFFIGYFIFEVPANVFLQKAGGKYWLSSIMILSGVVSGALLFVRTPLQFYVLRFLLGIAECGFFPGVILYLTFWYTQKRRGKAQALFMTGIPMSGVVSGALSAWIMTSMANVGGMNGWQWLFLIEGLLAVGAGLAAMVVLDDGPQNAKWLKEDERQTLLQALAEDEERKMLAGHGKRRLGDAFRSPQVWLLCLVYFGLIMATYGVGFWLPQILSETITKDGFLIGVLSMIPWGVGAIAMVINGHHSDKTGERRWHIAVPGLVGALAFALSAIPGISGVLGLLAITVATAGVMASLATFWTLPTAFLTSTAAAAGIAWINSVGNLAGYVSPMLVGKIRDATQSMAWPLILLSGCCFVAALIVTTFRTKHKAY